MDIAGGDYVAAYEDVVLSTLCGKSGKTTSTLSTDTPPKHKLRKLIGKKERNSHRKSGVSTMKSIFSVSPKNIKSQRKPAIF